MGKLFNNCNIHIWTKITKVLILTIFLGVLIFLSHALKFRSILMIRVDNYNLYNSYDQKCQL